MIKSTYSAAILIVLFLFLFAGSVEGQDTSKHYPMAHRVKAAFLCKFIRYMEWPESVIVRNQGTFTIGVFGDSPVAENLFALMPKEIDGWQLEIIQVKSTQDIMKSHMFFLSSSEKSRYPEIINMLKESSTLTVSDTPEFLKMGGLVNFIIIDQMVRFSINLNAAEKEGLKISSRLLKLATVIHR
jgi:hypothetical protein